MVFGTDDTRTETEADGGAPSVIVRARRDEAEKLGSTKEFVVFDEAGDVRIVFAEFGESGSDDFLVSLALAFGRLTTVDGLERCFVGVGSEEREASETKTTIGDRVHCNEAVGGVSVDETPVAVEDFELAVEYLSHWSSSSRSLNTE